MEVYLVHLIYQYDGWDRTGVYSTREKAINAADELLAEQQQAGYEVNPDYSNGYDKFSDCDDNCECAVIRLSDNCGDCEIIVEKKNVI